MDKKSSKAFETSQSLHWSEDPWTEKFERIPNIYYGDRIRNHLAATDGIRILDFGCGSGLITTGLAAYLNPSTVDAVDIESYINHAENREACNKRGLSYDHLLSKIEYHKRLPLEGLGSNTYDAIVSWSVIEHIPSDIIEGEMEILFQALKPGGIAILQSAPLYYSPFGSHIYSVAPWFHLEASEEQSRQRIHAISPNLIEARSYIACMESLNRLTHIDFRKVLHKAGFDMQEEYLTTTNLSPPERLTNIFQEEILTTEQVLFALTKS